MNAARPDPIRTSTLSMEELLVLRLFLGFHDVGTFDYYGFAAREASGLREGHTDFERAMRPLVDRLREAGAIMAAEEHVERRYVAEHGPLGAAFRTTKGMTRSPKRGGLMLVHVDEVRRLVHDDAQMLAD